jgi:beta-glucanase (GH16 family)
MTRARDRRTAPAVLAAVLATAAFAGCAAAADVPQAPAARSAATHAAAAAGTARPGWRLLASDDFDGRRLDARRWYAYGPRWPGNGGNGVRDGSAVSVGGGVLTITARMVDGTLVSGAVGSRIDRTYGRVEFRARTDADPSEATSGVVLLWPRSDDWPIDGEIDVYETGTQPSDRSWFSSFVHYGADNRQRWFGHDAAATAWHRMAMEWTPTAIRFYRDGRPAGTVTDPAAIPRVRHHLAIQLDALGPTMSGSVRMQVDDVRIYAPS